MSLNILDQERDNDPRSKVSLNLPKLRAGVAPTAPAQPEVIPNPPPEAPPAQVGPFTREGGPMPETPEIPFSSIPEPDISSKINPWLGDLNQLSIGDIQRLQISNPIPAPEAQPLPDPSQNFEQTDYDSVMKEQQESYEDPLGGYAEAANAILRSPQPIYAIPDPTNFSVRNPGPEDLGSWLEAQGHTDEAQTLPGNPFTTGDKKFKSNSLGNATQHGGAIGDFVRSSVRDATNLGNLVNPLRWAETGVEFARTGDWKKALVNNPLVKVLEGVGGDNGSYGDGAIGLTLRGLDLVDNTLRGTVADLFSLKRVGVKNNGSNLYRTTVGGQDYSFFQPRVPGASPFAALPKDFKWNRADHVGMGALALFGDFATGVLTGGAISKGVKMVKRLKGAGDVASVAKAANVPVPKKPPVSPAVTKVDEALRRARESVVSFDIAKQQVKNLLDPLAPGALPEYSRPLATKTKGLAGVWTDDFSVNISPSPSISPIKAPYNVQVQTIPDPALVPPRRFFEGVSNTTSISDALNKVDEVPAKPVPQKPGSGPSFIKRVQGTLEDFYPSVTGDTIPGGIGSNKIGKEKPIYTPGGQSATTAALFDAANDAPTNEAFIRNPFPGIKRVDNAYLRASKKANRYPRPGDVDYQNWVDTLPKAERDAIGARAASPNELPEGVIVRPGDTEPTLKVSNYGGAGHGEVLAQSVTHPPDIYLRLNIAKMELEKGNVLLGMDYLRSAAGGYDDIANKFPGLSRTVGKYFDNNGVFKAEFTPEVAKKIVKSYNLEAPQDIVEYVKGLFTQQANVKALFKAAVDDKTIIVTKQGDIIEKASVYRAAPVTEPPPPIVTATDMASSPDPQAIAGQVVARSIDEIPADPTALLGQQPSGATDPISQVASEARQNLVDGDNVAAVQNLDKASRLTSDLRAGGEQVDEAVSANFTPEGRLRLQEPSNPNALTPEELEAIAPTVRPDELVPMPKAHEAIEALRDDPDIFVKDVTPVSRSNADLTALAEYLGHVKTRKTPLSSKQIEVLRETHGSLYDKLGRAVDKNKLSSPVTRIETQAADSISGKPQVSRLKVIDAAPVTPEVPGSLKVLNDLLKKRDELLRNLMAGDLDEVAKVTDNIVNYGGIDYLDPENMEFIQKSLPSELQTASPNGRALTVEMLKTDDELADISSDLNQLEADIANLEKLSKSDSLKLADLTSAAPDTLEAGRSFRNDFSNMGADPDQPFVKLNKLSTGGITSQLDQVNWFHGSRVDPSEHDLRFIDPDRNTSLHEFGPGVYLTTDPDAAKHFAEAQPSTNLPQGTVLSDSGRVAQVIPKVTGETLLVNRPPTDEIKRLFKKAATEVGAPDEVIRSYNRKVGASESSKSLWESFYETYRTKVGESDNALFHRFQVAVANNLRGMGFGAVMKAAERNGDGSILNILGNGGDRMSLDIGKVSDAHNPSLLDALASRVNAEKSKGLTSESSEYLSTKARLEYNHTAQDLLKQRRDAAIDQAEELIDRKAKLEDIVREISKEEKRVDSAIEATKTKKSLDDISTKFNKPEDLNPCL